jgi:DNA-binding transcriptional LysR family regulator
MHVSPSSVSQRLKSLENDFGVKLYKRNKEGIELTDSGRILLGTASQVLSQLDTLRKNLNPDAKKELQTLIIGATPNPSAKPLPAAIAAFQRTHPDVKVTFLTAYRHTVEKWVRDGEVDIAIIQSPHESCMTELFTEHFVNDTLAVFTYAGHPLTRKKKIGFEDLAQTPLIIRDGKATTDRMLNLLRARGVKLNVTLRCASPHAVKAAVRKKMGIGILFRNQIEDDIRRKEIKVLRPAGIPSMIGNSYIVLHKDRPLSALATAFLALLREIKSRQKKPANIRTLTGTE